jgi:small subunit ribosomal protein S9
LTETPEDNERAPEEETEGAGPAEEPTAEEPTAEEPASEAPEPEEPSAEQAATEDPIVEQPAQEATQPPEAEPEPAEAEAEAVAEPAVAEPAPPAEPQAAAPEAPPAPEAQGQSGQADEIEVAPRQRPEIPGADLEPDLMPDSEQYLDAEAQAAAEAEAEAAAERARAEAEDEQARPIADAAIDLAAGARYTATGKRKTAVARVILRPGSGDYVINGKALPAFFPRDTLQRMIRQPLETVGYEARMDVVARMHGGGVAAQAGALRHGIARALIVADPNLRGELKRRGYLTRDPRVKERKKAGLKKARKRPQFSKR